MALICPVCSTENREGANFCKSCGTTLSATASRIPPPPSPADRADREWATTAPAQLRAPTIPAPLFDLPEPAPSSRGFFGKAPADEQTVILAPGQSSAPSSSSRGERAERKRSRTKVPRPPEPPEPPLRSRGLVLWLGLLVVAVVMVVAGWYGYGSRKAAEPVEAPPPPVAAPASVPAPAVAPPVVEPPPPEPVVPETPAVEMPAADAAPVSPAAAPKPAAKPRKQATAAPQPATPEAAAPAAVPAPPPPTPPAPAEPQALCGDRNFIAKAQCMAAQCLKPEFKAHAQCEAVRRQQRVEEEKRNPTLIN